MKKLSPEMERVLNLLKEWGGWHYPANLLTYRATLDALVGRGLAEKRGGPLVDPDLYRAKGD